MELAHAQFHISTLALFLLSQPNTNPGQLKMYSIKRLAPEGLVTLEEFPSYDEAENALPDFQELYPTSVIDIYNEDI